MNIVDRTYDKIAKRITLLCLITMLWMSAHSQVTVNLSPQAGISYSFQDLSLVSYINTTGQSYNGCYADISADDLLNGQSFEIRTAPFNISAGINTPGYAVIIGHTVVRPSDDYYSLEQKGKFPMGKYNLCLSLYTARGASLGKACITLNIEADGAVMLISPFDEEVIHTFTPTLVWQPYTLISDNVIKYNIHVAELNEGQSYGDAIGLNPPLVYEKDLSTTAFNYPTSAIALEEDKKYVWQVEVVAGSQKVSYSEIWMFQYKKTKATPPVRKPKVVNQQYPHLSKTISSAVYQYSDKIYFLYDNYANDSLLDYSIIKAGSAVPMKLEGKASIVLKPFNNYLAIAVSDQLKKESNKAVFLLEIHNSRKEKWALKFAINPKKKTNE